MPKKKPKLGPYEGMRPFPKWVRPTPAMAVEEVSSGEGDVEMEVPSGSSAARPPEVPKAPQLLSGTGTEGITDAEMMELRIIMDEDWSPPYRSPPAVWSCHGPLEHNQTGYFDFCLLCGNSHMRQMERWLRADKPALAIPHDRFMDHERLEMLIQARHPCSLCEGARAPDGILRGPRGGVHRGDPGGVRVGDARGSSSGQCGQTCSTYLDRGAAGEEAQEDRATSTQVGEEEGEAKGDQAVAGYPWCCSSLFGQMERMGGVAPPLGPGISAQAVFEVESEDESWGDWRGVKASLRVAPCTPPKYPQRPSTPPMPPRAGPMSDVAMGSTDLPLPDETSRFTLASTFARTVQHVHVRVQTCFPYFA